MEIIKLIYSNTKDTDLEEIKNIGKLSLPIYYNNDRLKDVIKNNNYDILVAKKTDKILGFAITSITEDDNIHIMSLACLPNFRRKNIDSDEYLKNIIFYIHKNPESHKLVSDFSKYEFSSYQGILNKTSNITSNHDVFKNIPVVVHTTSNNKADVETCRQLGIAGYFVKSVDYAQYKSNLQIILAYWSQSEQINKL